MQLQRSGAEHDTRFTCLGCSRLHSGERYGSEDISPSNSSAYNNLKLRC